ncbi:hypothetical protein PIB30_026966 [Stylosanthes scabra]|uniref:Uncharacterized protein n=1 Tax=Stylosanthes scabra TaxID=79078 RepID=A0ABU6QBE1_9FABA|nr:hypothetical protein [Stylosanthes scabra]
MAKIPKWSIDLHFSTEWAAISATKFNARIRHGTSSRLRCNNRNAMHTLSRELKVMGWQNGPNPLGWSTKSAGFGGSGLVGPPSQAAAPFSAIHRRLPPRRRLFSLLLPPAAALLLFCAPSRLWLRRPVVTAALALTVTPPRSSSTCGSPTVSLLHKNLGYEFCFFETGLK